MINFKIIKHISNSPFGGWGASFGWGAFLLFLLLITSCQSHPDVPSSSKPAKTLPAIYPDYCDVTVPCNIAPLNFMLPKKEFTECIARFTTPDGKQQTYGDGVKVQIPEDEWHTILEASKGKSIKVEVWGKKDDQWLSFKPFKINVAVEPMDEYVSYRLIDPTYVAWSFMEIAQRNISTFEETQIFNNEITSNEREKGQCINCHSYQNYKTDNMIFHVRLSNGGTVLVNDGKVSKINLKRVTSAFGGAYPSWHPSEKLIAFSANQTRQAFHTADLNKIEVYDLTSDLILYDIATDSVTTICETDDVLEVYPSWSPDGKYLYYCKTLPLPDDLKDKDIRSTFQHLQYNLYRRSFDIKTHNFGEEELIYDAASQNKSATLPRISPDGRYLLFAEGQYGCFHSRHRDADAVCVPLNDNLTTALGKESHLDLSLANSKNESDSYPTWSSNGRWIMIASRREDNTYSRIYFSYFKNGKAEKAFLLPQKDPEHNTWLLKSYNRPEFMVEPVRISVKEFSKVFDK